MVGTMAVACRLPASRLAPTRHDGLVAASARPAAVPGRQAGTARLPPPPLVVAPRRRLLPLQAFASQRGVGGRERQQRRGPPERGDEMQMWMDRLDNMRPSSRVLALQQLLRIEQEGAYAGLVGGSPGADTDEERPDARSGGGGPKGRRAISTQDQRQATDLVSSVTRWRRRLDYILGAVLNRPIEDLDSPLRQLLRMAVLEIAERGAPSHITNTYVDLAKTVLHDGAAKVANFALRELVRRRDAGALPVPPPPAAGQSPADAAEALAVGASHPTWLVASWLRSFGPKATLELLRWNNQPPRYCLRLAPGLDPVSVCKQLEEEGVQAEPSRYLPRHFVAIQRGMQALLVSGWVQRGDAQVQDEAAGLVVAMLDPQPGEAVLDACAAPGGKTLYSAALMQGRGSVLALDIGHARLAALRDMAARQEHGGIVRTLAMDLRAFAAEKAAMRKQQRQQAALAGPGAAAGDAAGEGAEAAAAAQRQRTRWDRVLLDAPCSGTGVLSKRADLRWRKQPADVEQMAGLQAQLLDAAAGLVQPGGLLVYSTCSLEPCENMEQVAAFLQRHPEYSLEPPPASAGVPPQCLTPDGCMATLPHVHGTDGAFAARLRRSAAE